MQKSARSQLHQSGPAAAAGAATSRLPEVKTVPIHAANVGAITAAVQAARATAVAVSNVTVSMDIDSESNDSKRPTHNVRSAAQTAQDSAGSRVKTRKLKQQASAMRAERSASKPPLKYHVRSSSRPHAIDSYVDGPAKQALAAYNDALKSSLKRKKRHPKS